MAKTNPPSQTVEAPDPAPAHVQAFGNELNASALVMARLNYSTLRAKMNQIGAVAAALRARHEPDTHEFYLAQLLDEMTSDATCWYGLDKFFNVDHNGNDAEANHG